MKKLIIIFLILFIASQFSNAQTETPPKRTGQKTVEGSKKSMTKQKNTAKQVLKPPKILNNLQII